VHAGVHDCCVVVSDGDELERQTIKRRWKFQRGLVELQCGAVTVLGDVGGGEAADAGRGLPVEQNQQARDSVSGLVRVVGKEPARDRPAFLGVQRPMRHFSWPAGIWMLVASLLRTAQVTNGRAV